MLTASLGIQSDLAGLKRLARFAKCDIRAFFHQLQNVFCLFLASHTDQSVASIQSRVSDLLLLHFSHFCRVWSSIVCSSYASPRANDILRLCSVLSLILAALAA